jgi:hypothetical protein
MESKKSLARTYPHLKVRFCNNFKAGNAFIVDNVAELLYQKLDWKLRNSDEFTTPLRINKDGRYHTLLDARLFISSTMQGDMNKNKLLRLLTSLSTRKKLKNKIKSIDEIRSELAQSLRALNQGQ